MSLKEQFCFWCGEPLGVFDQWPGDMETCGKQECEREARAARRGEAEERYLRAAEDDFSRY